MKNLTAVILVFVVVSFTVNAQRVIEKNIDYKNQFINVEIPFASEIELKTWNNPTVYVKANLSTDEGKYLDLYELDIKESSNRIDIVSKAEALFRKYQEEYEKENPSQEKNGRNNYVISENSLIIHNGMKYKFNYIIYIPEGAAFKLNSINGNLKSEIINGDFTADLINGNIDINQYSGEMKLKTINGEINIPVGDSSMTAETIHGNIYANENLEFTSEKRIVGQQIKSKKNGRNILHLSTINGNMYLR